MLRRWLPGLMALTMVGSLAGAVPAYASGARNGARPGPTLAVGGEVTTPTVYTMTQLAALPQTTVKLKMGARWVTDTGVLLEALVMDAGPAYPTSLVNTKNELLRVTATVGGSGFGPVTFAVGEPDPEFGDHPALLALSENGRRVAGGPQLVVPGDILPLRDVRHVSSVTVGIATGPATDTAATPPWWLPFGQLWALATVLANAFAPKWLPSYGRAVIRLPFGLVLIAAQTRGVLVYMPGRAVAVLAPPSNRPRLITNKLTRLSRTHWRLSNFGAWPTGTGIGTILLNHVCGLADAARINTCLRASNRDNQRLYRRFGFRPAADSARGTTMVRRFQPSQNPLASPAECVDVRLAGRLAKTLARQGRQAPNPTKIAPENGLARLA